MKNYEDEHNGKIPYDSDSIIRQSNYKKSRGGMKKSEVVSPNKAVALLVSILIIFNVILGIVVFTRRGGGGQTTNNNSYTINSDGLDVSAVTLRALPSVVLVNAGLNGKKESDLNADNFSDMASRGSGVIFFDNKQEGEAYIVTCNHVVVSHKEEIFVLLYDSYKPIKCVEVFATTEYDIAVLKIEDKKEYQDEYKKSGATACAVAESNYVSLGEDVVAIGNPLGKGFSTTSGIVSVTSELIDVDNDPYYKHRVMRISAPINTGNSGGGLFNARGELLGIVSVKSNDTSKTSVDCIAYAIPSTLAINIATRAMRNSSVERADFGITLEHDAGSNVSSVTLENGKTIAKRAVRVKSSTGESGLEVGDIILSFSFSTYSVTMVNMYSLEDYAFAMNKGERVTFEILRGGHSMQITAEVKNTIKAKTN